LSTCDAPVAAVLAIPSPRTRSSGRVTGTIATAVNDRQRPHSIRLSARIWRQQGRRILAPRPPARRAELGFNEGLDGCPLRLLALKAGNGPGNQNG
jgi:hypothetical protein